MGGSACSAAWKELEGDEPPEDEAADEGEVAPANPVPVGEGNAELKPRGGQGRGAARRRTEHPEPPKPPVFLELEGIKNFDLLS